MNTEKKTTTEKGKGGRPRSESPASLEKRVISYFEAQEAAGRFPTESGMLLHLGLCGEKAQAALNNPKYAEIWERASSAGWTGLKIKWSLSRGQLMAA